MLLTRFSTDISIMLDDVISRRALSKSKPVSKYIRERLISEACSPRRYLETFGSSSNSGSMAMYNAKTAKLPGDEDPYLVPRMPKDKLSNTLARQPRQDGATANSGRQQDSSALYKSEPVRK